MPRVEAADPAETLLAEHRPQVGPVAQPVGEAAGGAEAGRRDAEPRLHRRGGQADVVADDVGRSPALDQPGGPLEPELDVLRPRRQHVDVVVGVVADGMAGLRRSP